MSSTAGSDQRQRNFLDHILWYLGKCSKRKARIDIQVLPSLRCTVCLHFPESPETEHRRDPQSVTMTSYWSKHHVDLSLHASVVSVLSSVSVPSTVGIVVICFVNSLHPSHIPVCPFSFRLFCLLYRVQHFNKP